MSQYKWHARIDKRHHTVYAARADYYRENGKRCRRTIQMHREIMKTPDGMVVDHINGNGINNRRCNMRNCTQFENTHNARPRTDGKSRFIGVVPHKGKWLARVSTKGRRHHVGTFTDEVEAAKAHGRKALELFGRFARLNFPHQAPGH